MPLQGGGLKSFQLGCGQIVQVRCSGNTYFVWVMLAYNGTASGCTAGLKFISELYVSNSPRQYSLIFSVDSVWSAVLCALAANLHDTCE